jgi:hypothetical protein
MVSRIRTLGLRDLGSALSQTFRGLAVSILDLGLIQPAYGQHEFQTLSVGMDHRTPIPLEDDWHYAVDQASLAFPTLLLARFTTAVLALIGTLQKQ